MLKYNAVIISTTGAPGSGKTYSRCARFLWDYWLPEEKGIHYSNFPVNLDAFRRKYPDIDDRVKIIPDEELKAWSDFTTMRGPWTYFKDVDLQGAHLAFDECHNFLRNHGEGCQKNAERWRAFLGEIRHRGCTVEFLSQDPQKVHKEVEMHSAVRILLVNSEDRRDPWFGVLMGDWYELRAAALGYYKTIIWQTEERRINGKWKLSEQQRFALEPDYFKLYDSFNTPHHGGVKAEGQKRVFQKRGRVGALLWFLLRNWWRLGLRLAAVLLVVKLTYGGGIKEFWGKVQEIYNAQKKDKEEKARVLAEQKAAEREERLKARAEEKAAAKVAPAKSVVAAPEPIAVQVVKEKNDPVPVRSETVAARGIAPPPSGEDQQRQLPRVTIIAAEFVGLDDGQLIFIGETYAAYILQEIQFDRRRAVFRESFDGGEVLYVPVGGPLGRRLHKKESGGAPGSKPLSGLLP